MFTLHICNTYIQSIIVCTFFVCCTYFLLKHVYGCWSCSLLSRYPKIKSIHLGWYQECIILGGLTIHPQTWSFAKATFCTYIHAVTGLKIKKCVTMRMNSGFKSVVTWTIVARALQKNIPGQWRLVCHYGVYSQHINPLFSGLCAEACMIDMGFLSALVPLSYTPLPIHYFMPMCSGSNGRVVISQSEHYGIR